NKDAHSRTNSRIIIYGFFVIVIILLGGLILNNLKSKSTESSLPTHLLSQSNDALFALTFTPSRPRQEIFVILYENIQIKHFFTCPIPRITRFPPLSSLR